MKIELPNFIDESTEKYIIECLIQGGSFVYENIAETISLNDFWNTGYRETYRVLQSHFENGDLSVDPVIIEEDLKSVKQGLEIPTLNDLQFMARADVNTSIAYDLALNLKETTRKRELSDTIQDIAEYLTVNQRETANNLKSFVVEKCLTLDRDVEQSELLVDEFEQAKNRLHRIREGEEVKTVPTGFKHLDQAFRNGGLQLGSVNVIGARPSVGKTAFIIQMIKQMLEINRDLKPIILFSLEMSQDEVTDRFFTQFSGVSSNDLAVCHIQPDGWQNLLGGITNCFKNLENQQPRLLVCDCRSLNAHLMQELISSVYRKWGGVGAVFIDYLQLVTLDESSKKLPLAQALGDFSKALMNMASVFQFPVVAVCQLNREADSDRDPKLTDIKDSGQIEQDAHTVTILKNGERGNKKIYLIKNRSGRLVSFSTKFYGQFSKFDPEGQIIDGEVGSENKEY